MVKLDNGLVALLIEDHLGENRAKKKSRSALGRSTSRSSFEESVDSQSLEESGSNTGGSDESDGGTGAETDSGDNDVPIHNDVLIRRKMGRGKGKARAVQSDLDPDDLSVSFTSKCSLELS